MRPYTRVDTAVLTTLAYADIFRFPLTTQEITRYCIGVALSHVAVRRSLASLSEKQITDKTFFVLSGRKNHVQTRRIRGVASKKKWKIVSDISRWLSYIPTVKLIGVTGALAMGNAGTDDDIDLFFITRSKTVWITRMLVTVISEIVGNRRHPGQKKIADTICLNMFLSEDALTIPAKDRDLYIAHEVMQMVPVWEKDAMYARFISKNRWIKQYLPNWWKEKQSKINRLKKNTKRTVFVCDFANRVLVFLLGLIERPFRYSQILYMEKRRTREDISENSIQFHPRDTRTFVRNELSKRLTLLNIPLDKVFVMSIK